jgi:hypothetical protein
MRLLITTIILCCATACQHTDKEKPATFDIGTAQKYIAEMNNSYNQRFTTNDTAYYNERYCKDAAVYSPGMPAIVGRMVPTKKQRLNCQ